MFLSNSPAILRHRWSRMTGSQNWDFAVKQGLNVHSNWSDPGSGFKCSFWIGTHKSEVSVYLTSTESTGDWCWPHKRWVSRVMETTRKTTQEKMTRWKTSQWIWESDSNERLHSKYQISENKAGSDDLLLWLSLADFNVFFFLIERRVRLRTQISSVCSELANWSQLPDAAIGLLIKSVNQIIWLMIQWNRAGDLS